MRKNSEVKEMYPGLLDRGEEQGGDDLGYPVAPLNTLLEFVLGT